MKTNELVSGGLNIFTYIFAMMQTNQVFQTIEVILAILTSLVLIAYRIWRWWKEANADGKVTKEELKDGINILIDGSKEIHDKIKKGKEDKKDGESK